MGSVPGSIIGALILGLVESLIGSYIPNGAGWAEGVSFVVLILILIIRPRGIFGEEVYIH
jgi:branched-chain amino acid transport system permease protein